MPNFDSKNEGVWFYFDPENESVGGVCLRELTPEENLRIEKLTTKTKRKFTRGQLVEDTRVDEKLTWRLRWDYCIVDWSNVSLDGHPLECDTDNKVKMMNVTDFIKFVVEALNELVDSNKVLEEARVKNSGSSSSGNSESPTAESV
jgi:hypothetical protein